MLLTVGMLLALDACEEQVELFKSTFGGGVELTVENLTHGRSVGLALEWLGRKVWGEAFTDARAIAWNVYLDIQGPASEVYRAIDGPAYEAFMEHHDTEAYAAIRVPAYEAYRAVAIPACDAYEDEVVSIIFNLANSVTSNP